MEAPITVSLRMKESDIIIDKAGHGQATGYALVILESHQEAQRAAT